MIEKRNFRQRKANLNLGTKNKKLLLNTLTFSFVLNHSYITTEQLEIMFPSTRELSMPNVHNLTHASFQFHFL